MKSKWRTWGFMLVILIVALMIFFGLYFFGDQAGWDTWSKKGFIWLLAMLVFLGILMSPMIGTSLNHAFSKLTTNRKQLNPETAKEEKIVIDILKENETVSIDDINFKSGLSSSTVAAAILNLELQNVILSLPGKLYKIA